MTFLWSYYNKGSVISMSMLKWYLPYFIIINCGHWHLAIIYNYIYFSTDQLVCAYHTCTNDTCITGYEVCEENPAYTDREAERHVCFAVFVLDDDGNLTNFQQQCFDDPHSLCSMECAIQQDIPLIYDCCCTGHLCNNVEFNMTGSYSVCLFVFVCLSTTNSLHTYGREVVKLIRDLVYSMEYSYLS